MTVMETENFKAEISSVSLRVGRSGTRCFRAINQKRPLATICYVEELTNVSASVNERRVMRVMEVLEAGAKALWGQTK
jgi:hypothetical protein